MKLQVRKAVVRGLEPYPCSRWLVIREDGMAEAFRMFEIAVWFARTPRYISFGTPPGQYKLVSRN